MNQENKGQDMRAEYDIRGGVRGKYYERYVASYVRVTSSGLVHIEAMTSTASAGRHPAESTIRLVVEPIYPTVSSVIR